MSTDPLAEHDYGVDSDCICGRNFATVRGLREHITKSRPSDSREAIEPCASCGQPSMHKITLIGAPVPVCLRHLNVWRTPDWLAAHDAQVRAAERQKVAALLADEGIVEKVAEAAFTNGLRSVRDASAYTSGADDDYLRGAADDIARAALDVLAGLIGGDRG